MNQDDQQRPNESYNGNHFQHQIPQEIRKGLAVAISHQQHHHFGQYGLKHPNIQQDHLQSNESENKHVFQQMPQQPPDAQKAPENPPQISHPMNTTHDPTQQQLKQPPIMTQPQPHDITQPSQPPNTTQPQQFVQQTTAPNESTAQEHKPVGNESNIAPLEQFQPKRNAPEETENSQNKRMRPSNEPSEGAGENFGVAVKLEDGVSNKVDCSSNHMNATGVSKEGSETVQHLSAIK